MHSIHSSDGANLEENHSTKAPTPPPSIPELRRIQSASFDVSGVNNPKKGEDDPLAAFYAQARAEHETGVRQNICKTPPSG